MFKLSLSVFVLGSEVDYSRKKVVRDWMSLDLRIQGMSSAPLLGHSLSLALGTRASRPPSLRLAYARLPRRLAGWGGAPDS